MNTEEKYPRHFQEFLAQFPDDRSCWQYLIDIRYGVQVMFANSAAQNGIGLHQSTKYIVLIARKNFLSQAGLSFKKQRSHYYCGFI